jgi:acetyl-CoA carboxylase biotin carboxyl carrier protein
MKESYLKRLIRLVEESDIESLEVSSWGRKVRIIQRMGAESNGHKNSVATIVAEPSNSSPPPSNPNPAPEPATTESSVPDADNKTNLVEIKSPMVGTFYRAPSPDADPYVSLNERITQGQVVCIVEAMKLMNEIESEISGRVVKVLVENGKPVEFGQTLFMIDPNG